MKCCLTVGLSRDYYGISCISDLPKTLSSSTVRELHHITSDTHSKDWKDFNQMLGNLRTDRFHCCCNWVLIIHDVSIWNPLVFFTLNSALSDLIKTCLSKQSNGKLEDDSVFFIYTSESSTQALFLIIGPLKGFIVSIRGRLTWDCWCLTSVNAEGRLVPRTSIDPKPTGTWSRNPPTLMLDWFTDDWHLLAASQDLRTCGMLGLQHPRWTTCICKVFFLFCEY